MAARVRGGGQKGRPKPSRRFTVIYLAASLVLLMATFTLVDRLPPHSRAVVLAQPADRSGGSAIVRPGGALVLVEPLRSARGGDQFWTLRREDGTLVLDCFLCRDKRARLCGVGCPVHPRLGPYELAAVPLADGGLLVVWPDRIRPR